MRAPRYFAVVPAAGAGTRMGSETPKQYLTVRGRTLIEHTLLRLGGHRRIEAIAVALAADDTRFAMIAPVCRPPILRAVGGAERCHSVLAALDALAGRAAADDWVLVHDAARPCLRHADIDRLIATLADHPVGGLLALPVRDTMKRAEADGTIIETVERIGLWHALTPQMFRYHALAQALRAAIAAGALVTDEAQAMERTGARPRLVAGQADNIKVTRPQDLELAALYLERQEGEPECA